MIKLVINCALSDFIFKHLSKIYSSLTLLCADRTSKPNSVVMYSVFSD